ncbi:MAG: SpoIID/LytB domain-containing protein [Clostridia bacterium]|nr:SpoIID/LytB domain-containing protein [Clostridia bacterium]
MNRKLCVLISAVLWLTGCASQAEIPAPEPQATPAIPAKLERDESGQPQLTVYIAEDGQTQAMAMEKYVARVLAGEMDNDWPLEALKAQAVLARTFVLKFASEKESRYEGADISTDISEAQAYSEEKVNDRILQAVEETRGQVLSHQGELPYAWFHAHSGGTTARAQEGLGYTQDEPGYTRIAKGQESADAPDEAKVWEASFSTEEFLAACRKIGAEISSLSSLSISEYGESGRALTLLADDVPINAAELRIALGSTRMRSTLLTRLSLQNGQVLMAGKGYGHGVGMPQWGAYGLAQQGQPYEAIINAYFQAVDLVTLW